MNFDVVALGEAMVEFNQTRPGEPQFLQGFGGDTSNAAIAASRAGARAAYVSAVGNDVFGRSLLDLWGREGVDTSGVAAVDGQPTGIYFVTHGKTGHEFSYRRAGSAASQVLLSTAQLNLIARSKWLHYSGISQAISATTRQQCALAVAHARSHGVRVSFDSNLRLKLWPLELARQHMLQAIFSCDLFLPSIDDVTAISGLADPQAVLNWAHALGAKQVVLKLGADGAWASDGTSRTHIAAHQVAAVDATGAGDCFAGNLLARLCAGDNLPTATRYANAAAALAVQGFGAVAPLPAADAVRKFMESHAV